MAAARGDSGGLEAGAGGWRPAGRLRGGGGLLIGSSVGRREDRIDHILEGLGLEGGIFIRVSFLLSQSCICRNRRGLG